ncbi:hypothetical protein WMF31_31825 [Sorangium sp. So ce1036]|uniref:hypothetical protein n=1 Tax=Sorangium sp. So ce1036 TaxID=3133328 RepID=UPI003F05163D
MCKRDEECIQELADAIYESFKAQDPAYATPRAKAGIDEAIKFATLVATVQLTMGVLAARRFRAKYVQKAPTRDKLLDLLDRYLVAMTTVNIAADAPILRTIEPTRQMRALLETWEFNLDVPEPIVQVARAWLAADEIPEPPEGWDDWPGPEDMPQFEFPEQPSRGGP